MAIKFVVSKRDKSLLIINKLNFLKKIKSTQQSLWKSTNRKLPYSVCILGDYDRNIFITKRNLEHLHDTNLAALN